MGMGLFEDVQKRRDEVLQIAIVHGVTCIQIFGSVVRSEETLESDYDFIAPISAGKRTP